MDDEAFRSLLVQVERLRAQKEGWRLAAVAFLVLWLGTACAGCGGLVLIAWERSGLWERFRGELDEPASTMAVPMTAAQLKPDAVTPPGDE